MKGKYKARKVAAGYGPRHALNAQEGSEAVPSELPSPTTPEALGAVGRIAQQLPKEVARAGQQIAGFGPGDWAQLALGALSGGEEEPSGLIGALPNAIRTNVGELPIRDPSESVTGALQSHTNTPAGARIEYPDISELSGGVTRAPNVKALTDQMSAPGGYISRLIVDGNNNVIEGAHRLEALRNIGATKVPVVKIFGAEDFVPDVDALKNTIRDSGVKSSDQVNQLASHVGEILMDEGGDATALKDYDAPEGYEKPWDAVRNEILRQHTQGYARGTMSVGPRHADNAFAGGESNIKPGSINDEVPLPVQGNSEMVETPTDTSHQQQVQPLDIPPASETPEVNLDTLGQMSPQQQMQVINALGYEPNQVQGSGYGGYGGGGMQLINELGYDPSHAYGSSGSGVPTQTGAGYGGQFVGGLLGNLLLPGIGGLVGSQLGGAGARMLTRSLQGGQVPWQTSAPQTAGAAPSGGSGLGDLFPQGTGGLGEPMGYFPWYSPGETGSSSYAPFTGGVGGEGGTLGNSDMSNVGAGPLPGSFAGLGSFGGGDLGSYGGGIGEHTPSFQAWVQGQGFPNVASYQAAMAGPPGPTMAMAGGGGGAPVGLQHATGGHITTAQQGKSNVHSTDTVPAMLTPREAVLNRNAAELAGRGKIQELNAEGNQLADEGVDLAGKDKNMKQKYQRGAARIAPVPLTGPKPTARADLAGIMKYLPMGQLARSAQSQAVMPKAGVRGYQAGTSATDPLSMYQSKLGSQGMPGGVPGPSPFPGPSPSPNPGPGPMPVSTMPPQPNRPPPTPMGQPQVPTRPDALDPTKQTTTPIGFNNWAANAGAPGFVTQPVPPAPNPDGTLNPSPSPQASKSFFPQQKLPPPAPVGFQGGSGDVIGSPQAGTQFANVQYSAPQINIAALKQHLQSQGIQPNQISGIINQIAQYRSGGGVDTGMTTPGGMSIVNSLGYDPSQPQGYQGGISDIGYPPMVGPDMVYHADKGSNWIGQFDPRYTFQRYWRGTGAVMPMGAGLGPVMGARPFVHPVRPVPPVRF